MRPDTHSLVPLHAAGALDAREAADVERHLAECAACREDLDDLRETLALMAEAVGEEPPPRLRAAVLAGASDTPQERTASTAARDRRSRRGPAVTLLALAASVAVVAAGVAGVGAVDRARQAESTEQAIAAVLAATDSRLVRAPTEDGSGEVVVAVSDESGQAVLVTEGLAPAPSDRDWQAWYVSPDGGVRSAGLVELSDAGRPVLLSDVAQGDALALTLEPDGGSAKPTTDPVVVVPLA
jgi:anti-sigma-K factor RskA